MCVLYSPSREQSACSVNECACVARSSMRCPHVGVVLEMHRRHGMKALLMVLLLLGAGGLAFSGYLTYLELFASAGQCSPLGEAGTILGAPPCVYGFFMYLAIVIVTTIALLRVRRLAA